MTTHVPDGTPGEAVDGIRAREAARAHELAEAGHLLRLWNLPRQAGQTAALGLWQAEDAVDMQAILESLPLYSWMTVEVTPLTEHPNDPAVLRGPLGGRTLT